MERTDIRPRRGPDRRACRRRGHPLRHATLRARRRCDHLDSGGIEMKNSEKFVMRSVAIAYSGDWKPGADPPDAYLTIADRTFAVEVSTLTQHVTDDRGTRPRPRDDIPAS